MLILAEEIGIEKEIFLPPLLEFRFALDHIMRVKSVELEINSPEAGDAGE